MQVPIQNQSFPVHENVHFYIPAKDNEEQITTSPEKNAINNSDIDNINMEHISQTLSVDPKFSFLVLLAAVIQSLPCLFQHM